MTDSIEQSVYDALEARDARTKELEGEIIRYRMALDHIKFAAACKVDDLNEQIVLLGKWANDALKKEQ